MATVTQLRDRLKRRLSLVGVSIYDVDIVDELTHAQVEILEREAKLPFFLKTPVVEGFTSTTPLTLGGANIPRFIRFVDEEASLGYIENNVITWLKRYDNRVQLEQLYGTPELAAPAGTRPRGYYWNGNRTGNLLVLPFTTETLSWRLSYYQAAANTPAAPDGADSTAWTIHGADLLLHTAGLEISQAVKSQDGIAYFSSKRQEAWNRMFKADVASEVAATELVMGE